MTTSNANRKAYDENADFLSQGYVCDVPLDLVQPDPTQPRRVFDDKEDAALGQDIKANGQINPITVRLPRDGSTFTFIIESGERRFRACQFAKLKTIRAILAPAVGEEVGSALRQYSENMQRRDLSVLEQAAFYATLRDTHGMGPTEIAKTLTARGMPVTKGTVSSSLAVLALPEPFQALMVRYGWGSKHARFLGVGAKLGAGFVDQVVAQIAEEEKDGHEFPQAWQAHALSELLEQQSQSCEGVVCIEWGGYYKGGRLKPATFNWKVKLRGALLSCAWDRAKLNYCTDPALYLKCQTEHEEAEAKRAAKGSQGKGAGAGADAVDPPGLDGSSSSGSQSDEDIGNVPPNVRRADRDWFSTYQLAHIHKALTDAGVDAWSRFVEWYAAGAAVFNPDSKVFVSQRKGSNAAADPIMHSSTLHDARPGKLAAGKVKTRRSTLVAGILAGLRAEGIDHLSAVFELPEPAEVGDGVSHEAVLHLFDLVDKQHRKATAELQSVKWEG